MKYLIDLQKLADTFEFELEDVEIMINAFIEDSTINLEELRVAIESNNINSICQNAHSIKGTASNFLFHDISTAAKEVEESAREGNLIDCKQEYIRLKGLLEGLVDE